MVVTEMELHPSGNVVLIQFDGRYVLELPAAELSRETIGVAQARLEARAAAVADLRAQLIAPNPFALEAAAAPPPPPPNPSNVRPFPRIVS